MDEGQKTRSTHLHYHKRGKPPGAPTNAPRKSFPRSRLAFQYRALTPHQDSVRDSTLNFSTTLVSTNLQQRLSSGFTAESKENDT